MRASGRKADELRPIFLGAGFAKYAQGSCFVKFGNTHILCTATIEEKVPPFLRNSGTGWITAEYGMLPTATQKRTEREASLGRQSGRTQEIQRLIGRSLRAVMDLKALGERQVRIDCDVLQADGGTRTASITGAYVALHQALTKYNKHKPFTAFPLIDQVAAVSCGLVVHKEKQEAFLDLDYVEDSSAVADGNFVFTGQGKIVEIQTSAEKGAFAEEEFRLLLTLAQQGTQQLLELQQQAVKGFAG